MANELDRDWWLEYLCPAMSSIKVSADSTGESQAVHCTLQRGHDGAHAGLVLWVAEHG